MQGRGQTRPPLGIAFEADFGQRIDAILAVAMLNGFTAKGECRRIALCISRTSIPTARLADVVSGFYAPRPVGGSSMIGMPEDGPVSSAEPLTAILTKTAADGAAVYESNIETVLDTADNAVHIRNVLLAQFDGNAAIVVAGPATGMARLMNLFGARPQIEAKAARLVMAVGAFGPNAAAEPAAKADVAALRSVLAEWPTPIVMVGAEVGEALPYPASSIETGFAWSQAPHPVVDTYRAFKAMPHDAPASALAATLYAVHPDEGFFQLSEPGTITVGDDGQTRFAPSPDGRHRHLIVDPAQKARVLQAYTALVEAPPAPRPGRRGGPPPAQQQQRQPPQQQRPQPAQPPAGVPPVAPPARPPAA
jgi:hypothetical protein